MTVAISELAAQKSIQQMEAFLEAQEPWVKKAGNALEHDFSFETISICLRQINAILRKGLWIEGQLQALKNVDRIDSEYMTRLMEHPRELLQINISNAELYMAAEKQGFINNDMCMTLTNLSKQSDILLQTMFKTSVVSDNAERIAKELLIQDEQCLMRLSARTALWKKLLSE